MELAGQRILITGGARGIGLATGRELAAAGARVALLDIEADRVQNAAADLGPQHLGIVADVTDSAALDAAVQTVVTEFGGLDVIVANAGIASWHTVRDTDIDAFAATIDINLTGVFRTVRAALPHIIDSKGYILVVTSLASILPMPGGSAYGASKSGAEGFANALRLEMHPHGVAVGSAHMTIIRTDLVGDLKATSDSVGAALDGFAGKFLLQKSAEECAHAFVVGIRRRSRRIYVPRAAFLLQWLRPVLYSNAFDIVASRAGRPALNYLLAHVASLKTSTADRNRNHVTSAPHDPSSHHENALAITTLAPQPHGDSRT